METENTFIRSAYALLQSDSLDANRQGFLAMHACIEKHLEKQNRYTIVTNGDYHRICYFIEKIMTRDIIVATNDVTIDRIIDALNELKTRGLDDEMPPLVPVHLEDIWFQ